MKPTLIGLVLMLGLALTVSVQADERILSFHSDITVHEDGAVVVEENIRVVSEGKKIRRGIYRDFPTRYEDQLGNRYRVGFELLGVQRDGLSESYRTESLSDGVRIYIGRPNHFLPRGEYVYSIKYRTDWQLGFFADHDELYWNVTGNGWEFPIDQASATVNLPSVIRGADVRVQAYTGYHRSRAQNYVAEIDNDGTADFKTTTPLRRREGLTIVVAWPKGFIIEPGRTQKIARFLKGNRDATIVVTGMAVLLLYFVVVWYRVGRDPEAGVIFPRYVPPKDVSPASARFIYTRRHDDKAFAAAVLSLAVKGKLKINTRAGYSLTKISDDESNLAPGERVILERLFAGQQEITLKQKNHLTFRRAIQAHAASLRRDYGKLCFRENSRWLVPGAVLAIILPVVVMAFNPSGLNPRLLGMIATAVLGVGAITAIFYYLLRAPTRTGRKLLDEIEGLRLFLEVADKQELQMKGLPEKTPRLFEMLLPYAVALDVGQQWSEQFAEVLADLKARGVYDHPTWYEGAWDVDHMDVFSRSVGRSLTSAVAVSSTPPAPARPPGSSSGYDWGDGGFDGGGVGGGGSGGGGGGGGW